MESPKDYSGDICDNRMPLSLYVYQNAKSIGKLPKSSTEQNPQENLFHCLLIHTESLRRSTAESLDGKGALHPSRKRNQPSYLTNYVIN